MPQLGQALAYARQPEAGGNQRTCSPECATAASASHSLGTVLPAAKVPCNWRSHGCRTARGTLLPMYLSFIAWASVCVAATVVCLPAAGRRLGSRCRAAVRLSLVASASFPQPRLFPASRLQDGDREAAAGPPYALMDAPPLAVFANGLAAALNELRHCPPLVLQQPATAVVQASHHELAVAIVPRHSPHCSYKAAAISCGQTRRVNGHRLGAWR